MTDPHQPQVSIVIPVHNGRDLLVRLLVSIAKQSLPPVEVIVVDNASTDGAPDAAVEAGCRVIAMGWNAGFASAVNRGIREARSEWIALLNSDVELDPSWVELLWSATDNSGSSFGTGKILQAAAPDHLDGSYDLICRGGCAWRAGAGQLDRADPAYGEPADPYEIQLCSATAVLYKASMFRTVGFFEESFESYLEDVDLSLRCAAAGLKGIYVPQVSCLHHGSATFGRWHPRVVRLIARNQVLLLARNYSRDLLKRWWWPILVAHGLWGILAIRHGCGIAWLSGKLSGMWSFRSARREASSLGCLAGIVCESERQLYDVQSRGGFDWYWKMYFTLAGVAG